MQPPRIAALTAVLLACATHPAPAEPVVGGPCQGCEAVFDRRGARLTATGRIAGPDEPGEALVLEGTVRDAAGTPVPGVIVYAYHTDAKGLYPRPTHDRGRAADRHGRLRGFARTDRHGRYRFDTIRPGHYPGRDIPQHVHMHVVEPGRCTYTLDDVVFTDDPLLRPGDHDGERGGSGVVTPSRDEDGRWRARRDVVLGAGIAHYERCGTSARAGS